ncbi:hypothetical protein GCM10025869_20740 [Homoserinibacter gongjuensis]|uniref:Uncharacterized protein n=1 Tax=Homoserinibacter gongjuensis TaxID=1162968 RepID=A0ABQ6JTA1_9MICO|nr:hypothetical protein GCM10025869_20740 [Homoserinibacter gongjuensis]
MVGNVERPRKGHVEQVGAQGVHDAGHRGRRHDAGPRLTDTSSAVAELDLDERGIPGVDGAADPDELLTGCVAVREQHGPYCSDGCGEVIHLRLLRLRSDV